MKILHFQHSQGTKHQSNRQVLQPTITPLRWCPSNRSRPFLSKNLETIKYWKSSQSIVYSQERPMPWSSFSHLANPWRTPSLKNPSSFSPSVNATFALPSNLITILISSFLVLSNVWSAHKHCGPVPPVVALHPSYPSTWRRRHPAPEKIPIATSTLIVLQVKTLPRAQITSRLVLLRNELSFTCPREHHPGSLPKPWLGKILKQ